MAANYRYDEVPPKWVSGHRDNEYKIRLPRTTASSGFNAGGYLRMNLTGAFLYPIAVGSRIYMDNNSGYPGYHTIKEINSSVQITLNTPFTITFGGANTISQVVLPEISIYKGYKFGELIIPTDNGPLDLSTIQPYTLVAKVKPEAGLDGFIRFNFAGYSKAVIEAPYKGAYNPDENNFLYPYLGGLFTFTPKYYNKIRLLINGGTIGQHYVANSSISTQELNQNFVDCERNLSPLIQPAKIFNQILIGNYITGDVMLAVTT